MLSPTEHPLTIAAAAWSPGTPGRVRGPVVYFDAKRKEDFDKYHGKLKGAIVIWRSRELVAAKPVDPNRGVHAADEEPPARWGSRLCPIRMSKSCERSRRANQFWKEQGGSRCCATRTSRRRC